MENKFSKEDKEKLIKFLNLVAKHAKFNVNTEELIEYFKLLSFMQNTMIFKVDANIFEIEKVIEAPKKSTSKKAK